MRSTAIRVAAEKVAIKEEVPRSSKVVEEVAAASIFSRSIRNRDLRRVI